MKRVTIAILLVTFLAGCSKTLTRGKAKDLIWEKYHYGEGTYYEFHPTNAEIEEGIKRGLWTSDDMTQYGSKFFEINHDCHCMKTVVKVHPEIEVTGITGGATSKAVEFRLYWFGELPRDVREVFKNREPDHESCIMRLYDDGWRIRY